MLCLTSAAPGASRPGKESLAWPRSHRCCEEKLEIQAQFAKLPRNSCPTRLTRRCRVSGRSHAVYRKFGLSRIALREMTLRGELPGMRKSSW